MVTGGNHFPFLKTMDTQKVHVSKTPQQCARVCTQKKKNALGEQGNGIKQWSFALDIWVYPQLISTRTPGFQAVVSLVFTHIFAGFRKQKKAGLCFRKDHCVELASFN